MDLVLIVVLFIFIFSICFVHAINKNRKNISNQAGNRRKVKENDCVFIIGESGCGKTRLFLSLIGSQLTEIDTLPSIDMNEAFLHYGNNDFKLRLVDLPGHSLNGILHVKIYLIYTLKTLLLLFISWKIYP